MGATLSDMEEEAAEKAENKTIFDLKKEAGYDTIQAAHNTRQHQGHHEAEVTFGGEADLQKHHKTCIKNPGHTHFIPIADFKVEHLPPDYRNKLVLDWIKAEADVTCRLSVRYTSEKRHLFYPFSQDKGYGWTRMGTGWLYTVDKMSGEKCKCKECSLPDTLEPKREWGQIKIYTACHVVFDSDEARHTTCHFFYDEGSTDISQCPSATGLSVVETFTKKDMCLMKCVTHDMDLVDKLLKMESNRYDLLYKKLDEMYKPKITVPCEPSPLSRVTVIVSHPHGMSKQVTVGEWTDKQILSPPRGAFKSVDTCYSYNAATCPGSSGAPVIILPENSLRGFEKHPHSEGYDGNNNKSGYMVEVLPELLT